ncbi:MAG: MarR family transcriptional regulator [Woeseiaceae bacterium]|nr:MarR family transcriptional regulator [Woeseiaceae bacterium]
MKDRSHSALVALRRILRATELNARQLASRTGLTPSQFIVLQLVARAGKTLPTNVARDTHLSQATVTALVDKLEKAGLVIRHRDTEDRRRIWIELTPAGRQHLDSSPDLLQHRFEQGYRELPDWQQALIVAALEKVSAMLDAGAIDASPVLDVGDIDR